MPIAMPRTTIVRSRPDRIGHTIRKPAISPVTKLRLIEREAMRYSMLAVVNEEGADHGRGHACRQALRVASVHPSATSGRTVPPGCDDQQAEHGIGQREHPRRKVVVEQAVYPVLR